MKFGKVFVGLMLLIGLSITAAADETQVVRGSDFSFTLPDHSWRVPSPSDPEVSIDLVNDKLQSRIKFAIRDYQSPLSVLNKDIISLSTDPGITAPDTAALISNQLLVINGVNYYRVDIIVHHKENNSDTEFLHWMTVKNKQAYQFCCGGPKDNRTVPLAKVCGDVASTLRIK